MRVYDISVAIEPGMPLWPGDVPLELERVQKINHGDIANVTRISCSVHVGTHVDAPIHFLEDGRGIETLSFRVLNGRAYVVDLPDVDLITSDVLENAGVPPRTRRVLFKTTNSQYWNEPKHEFKPDFVGLDQSASHWLVKKGVQLVGVDYLSVAPFDRPQPTHKTLLANEVVILEGLDLRQVSQGRYMLHCLPLKISGCDGAPARAILTGV
jgi:arylformamidase